MAMTVGSTLESACASIHAIAPGSPPIARRIVRSTSSPSSTMHPACTALMTLR